MIPLFRNIIFTFILLGNTSFVIPLKVDIFFGICLKPRYETEASTFALIQEVNGQRYGCSKIDESTFALMASGQMKSAANEEQLNLFEEFGVPYCEVTFDSIFSKHYIECIALDRLWKLRYQKKPGDASIGSIESAVEAGWAEKPQSPSIRQMAMLSEFGITSLNKYAKGESCFLLLKAISDPVWVARYRGI